MWWHLTSTQLPSNDVSRALSHQVIISHMHWLTKWWHITSTDSPIDDTLQVLMDDNIGLLNNKAGASSNGVTKEQRWFLKVIKCFIDKQESQHLNLMQNKTIRHICIRNITETNNTTPEQRYNYRRMYTGNQTTTNLTYVYCQPSHHKLDTCILPTRPPKIHQQNFHGRRR